MKPTQLKYLKSYPAAIIPLVNDQFFPACIDAINHAQHSISLCTFAAKYYRGKSRNTVNQFFDSLRRAAQRGVNIRLLLNGNFGSDNELTNNTFIIRYFKNPNFQAALAGKSTRVHAKIILIDGHLSILGSHNLSQRAHNVNFETSILIDSEPLNQELQNHFERLWRNRVLVQGAKG
mgnify:CR=1 FL=1